MAKARRVQETHEVRDARRAVAFERGWVDSLQGYFGRALQPIDDIYDYMRGWNECADYRWRDPSNRGVAPDPTFRPS